MVQTRKTLPIFNPQTNNMKRLFFLLVTLAFISSCTTGKRCGSELDTFRHTKPGKIVKYKHP